MTLILALDISKKSTGWAIGRPGEKPRYGAQSMGKPSDSFEKVLLSATRWLTGAINEAKPDLIAIEAPIRTTGAFAATQTSEIMNALNAVMRMVAYTKLGRESLVIAPSSARKSFTGTGKFEKGQAKQAVYDHCRALGWIDQTATYDMTDACCIWAAACVREDPSVAASFTPLMMAGAN